MRSRPGVALARCLPFRYALAGLRLATTRVRAGRRDRGTENGSRTPDAGEHYWIDAGRLHVGFDGPLWPSLPRIALVADGGRPSILHGERSSLAPKSLRNGDFSHGTDGWQLIGPNTAELGVDLAHTWTLAGGHTAFVSDASPASMGARLLYAGTDGSGRIPVTSGAPEVLSLLVGTHHCTAEIELEFLDRRGRRIGAEHHQVESGIAGGRDATGYERVTVSTVVPRPGRWARISIRKSPTIGTARNSHMFVADVGLNRLGEVTIDPDDHPEVIASISGWKSPAVIVFALPGEIVDGRPHELIVVDAGTGRRIEGTPSLTLAPEGSVLGGIESVEGTALAGWVHAGGDRSVPTELAVEVDGREVERTFTSEAGDGAARTFRVPLPTQYFDGMPHSVRLRTIPAGVVVHESTSRLPGLRTPWDTRATGPEGQIPGSLATTAALRYRSLQLDLESMAAGRGTDPVRERQLCLVKAILQRDPDVDADYEPLTFPSVAEPCVSIVIPAHDEFRLTHRCLAALLFAHTDVPFEVIVVDDASSDETRELERLVEGITVTRNDENRGFVHACNKGAKSAKGKFIAFLNNDTEVTARWLDELVLVFRNYPHVGLAGSRLIYPDGRLQEAGGIVSSDGEPYAHGRGADPHLPQYAYTRQADYISGASIMVDRMTWTTVGGFNEQYAPAYFEDTDLAFKVRAAGRRVVYAALSQVIHKEGGSSGTDPEMGVKRFQEINRPKFKRAWAAALRAQPPEATDRRLAADHRGTRRRAVMVGRQIPRPDRSAGDYAAVQEIRLLQALGYKVTFLPEDLEWQRADTEYLQRMGVEVLYAPFCSGLDDLLDQRGPELDLVYIHGFDAAIRSIGSIRRMAPQAKVLLQLADLHFLREIRDHIAGHGDLEAAVMTRDAELEIIRQVDVALSYSEVERAVILSHDLGQGRIATAPWVVDVREGAPRPGERAGIAFLGSYDHPPNRRAVMAFCRDVMPLVRERLPNTTLHVFGHGWAPAVTASMAADGVIFEGYVPEVSDAYDKCRVAVAPLITGAGIKGKVIDALAHGIPQVVSPVAVEGTGLRHGLEVLVAETPEAWVGAVVRLYEDDSLWESLSHASRDYARSTYSFESGLEIMRRAIGSVEEAVEPAPEALVVDQARPETRVAACLD